MAVFHLLDIFFLVFHTALTLFNLTGWIWRKTRLLNLITLSLTGFSWTILGKWYGFGYCPCTDWHWEVRWELGYRDMPRSYLKFLVDHLTGLNVDPVLMNRIAAVAFSVAFLLSLGLNLRAYLRKRGYLSQSGD